MKLHLYFIALITGLCALTATAQLPSTSGSVAAPPTPPVSHSFSLDVQTKATGGGSTKKRGDNAFSSGQTSTVQERSHSTVLQIGVRNFGKEADQAHVEWFFFGKPVLRGTREFVFDSGAKDINIQAMGVENFEIASKVATSNTTTTATQKVIQTGSGSYVSTTYSDSDGGTKLTGWIVRISVDGKILQVRASDFRLEEIARDPDKFNALKSGK